MHVSNESVSCSSGVSSRRPTDPVNVVLHGVWEIVVYNIFDILYIQTSRSNVSGNKNRSASLNIEYTQQTMLNCTLPENIWDIFLPEK